MFWNGFPFNHTSAETVRRVYKKTQFVQLLNRALANKFVCSKIFEQNLVEPKRYEYTKIIAVRNSL